MPTGIRRTSIAGAITGRTRKWGVPVVFFTTGGHADYHQVTDEPQYIRYESMAVIDRLIFDIAVRVADLDHRVVVDHPKPNPAPATVCKQ